MRRSWIVLFLLACVGTSHAVPTYTVEEAVALARKQNAEIAMAAKQVEAARGGVVEARAGSLPSVVSTGLLRTIQRQETSPVVSSRAWIWLIRKNRGLAEFGLSEQSPACFLVMQIARRS